MAPELSPDGGTTTSTNSTSPALSSTLSESSSLMDANILQQQQQQQQQITLNTSTQPQQIQVVRTNHPIDQQSPGQQVKLPDQLLETNAYANKTEPSLSNNLLIMANEHKEFSCSVGDENLVNPTSKSHIVVDNKSPESDEVASKSFDNEEDSINSSDEKDSAQIKNPNLSVASNIANAFINLSNLNSSPKNGSVTNGVVPSKNMNVTVTQQQIAQHFMKTLSFTTSRGGIFVPNVIATNITPQFTVHQYGLHGNPNGPAPNVTVNPNGNFNTNLNAIRPGAPNHFRLLFQQTPNINLNLINNQPVANSTPTSSSILEASLQTINKVTNTQPATKSIPTKTIIQNPVISHQSAVVLQKQKSTEDILPESTHSQDTANVNNDQHIRVLTPSEIMKTLPSLSSQDNICFNNSNMVANDKNQNQTDSKPQISFTQNSETSGSVANNSIKNSTNSSPLTITSECNTLSSNFVTTKATMSSNNAQIQMVSGYKTYKNILRFFFAVFLSLSLS